MNPSSAPYNDSVYAEGQLSVSYDFGLVLAEQQATFWLTNEGDIPIEIQFNSAKEANLSLLGSNGDVIWSWESNRFFIQSIRHISLKPSSQIAIKFDLPKKVIEQNTANELIWQFEFFGLNPNTLKPLVYPIKLVAN